MKKITKRIFSAILSVIMLILALPLTGFAASKTYVDYGDIIVHLFRKEERDYFALERLWNNGRNLSEH